MDSRASVKECEALDAQIAAFSQLLVQMSTSLVEQMTFTKAAFGDRIDVSHLAEEQPWIELGSGCLFNWAKPGRSSLASSTADEAK